MAHWSIILSEIKSSFENHPLSQHKTPCRIYVNGVHNLLDSHIDVSRLFLKSGILELGCAY